MTTVRLPPPPVPARLREMLRDYPGHLQELQKALNDVVEKPSPVTPPFELAVWMLEDTLSDFVYKARDELQAAETSGDAAAIERAKKKKFAMGSARLNMGGMPDLHDYFEAHKDAVK